MHLELAEKVKVTVEAQTNVWVTLCVPCELSQGEAALTILHGSTLLKDLEWDTSERDHFFAAIREVLFNAIEHGGKLNPNELVHLDLIRTRFAVQFFVKDPGPGFHMSGIPHAAINNPPDDVVHHAHVRQEHGMRPGGFGILMAQTYADELIYNQAGNEVLLIKYLKH